MKRITTACLILLVLLFLSTAARPTHAQGFVLGMMAGEMLFGGGSSQYGGGGVTILYTLPRVSERVRDPLAIRLGVTYVSENNQGRTIRQLFSEDVRRNPSDLEILQVVQALSHTNRSFSTIWFFYIEKHQVRSLGELPKESPQSPHSK